MSHTSSSRPPRPRPRARVPRPRPPTTRWAPHTRRQREQVGQEVRFARNPWCRVVGVPRYRLAMPPSYLRHPHLTATRSSSSPRTTCGRRRSTAAAPTGSPPTACRWPAPDLARRHPRGVDVDAGRAPEVFVTEVEGGAARRLTWWGDHTTKLIGWTPEGEVLAVSAAGQPSRRQPWAHVIPATGGTPRRLPLGPLADLAQRAEGPAVLLSATMTREMAWRKRYRGGTAGKLWWNPEGDGGSCASPPTSTATSTRRCWSATGSPSSPTTRAGATSTPSRPDGADLRRHTDHGARRARVLRPPRRHRRHPRGLRVGRASSGCSTTSTREPGRSTSGSAGPAPPASPAAITTGEWLGRVRPDATGRSSVVGVRGTVHRLTHRDGPARTLQATPGVRARLAAPLGEDRAVWVDDALGEDAVCIAPLDPRAPDAPRDAAVRRVRPRVGARARARRRERRPHHARRAAAAARATAGSASWPAAATARSTTSRSPRTAPGWPTATRWARASRRSSSCGWKTARRCRSPRAASATPTRCSRSTASTWRSCRCAASTRSTTSTPSTSRSPPPGGRSSCRSARARRRRSGRARTGARSRRRTTSRRTRPALDASDPGDETEEAPSREEDEEGRRPAGGGRRHRGARRAGWCRSRSSRAATAA